MSVAGKWQVTMPTPIGTMQFAWDLDDSGGSWKGKMSGSAPLNGEYELTGIKVNGNAISFATTVNSPMGALPLTFEGTAAGDALSGTCKTRFGDNQFSAVRA